MTMEENKHLYKNIGGGLQSLPSDQRDFSFGQIFSEPVNLADIDQNFTVGSPLEIKDQGTTDLCTAYATVAASELQERIKLSPEYTFAKIKELRGEYEQWGADLRSACSAATKYGFLAKIYIPQNMNMASRDTVANWLNWPSKCDEYAETHKKESYFRVQPYGAHDMFDSLLIALWLNKEENRAVITGALWREEWTAAEKGLIPYEYSQNGFGHAFILIGSRNIAGTRYLVAQLSNGTAIGDAGLFYFPRNIVNKEFVYGAYTFKDMPKAMAGYLNEHKISNSFWSRVRFYISNYFGEIFR